MAVALTSGGWYSWLAPELIHGQPFSSGVRTAESMIPLGSDSGPRLVIGHNIAYDRVRVGDEYQLEQSGTRSMIMLRMAKFKSAESPYNAILCLKQGKQGSVVKF